MAPIDGDALDAERGKGFGECVGKILDARFRNRQLVGETESGRVEHKAGETFTKNRE
jgi:hypothetical protein